MDQMTVNVRNRLGALLMSICEAETVVQQRDDEIAELKDRIAELEAQLAAEQAKPAA